MILLELMRRAAFLEVEAGALRVAKPRFCAKNALEEWTKRSRASEMKPKSRRRGLVSLCAQGIARGSVACAAEAISGGALAAPVGAAQPKEHRPMSKSYK